MKINTFEMTKDQETDLINKILKRKNGVVIFDGPTGSGKTMLVNMLLKASNKAVKFSSEQIVEAYIKEIKKYECAERVLKNMVEFLDAYKLICIEDIDLLWEKECTQEAIAAIVNIVSEESLVIFTGIGIEERVPELLKRLKEIHFINFEKKKE